MAPVILFAGLAIAGAVGGLLTARLVPAGDAPSPTVTGALERGRTVSHHGWSLTLKGAQRYVGSGGKATLQLILGLEPPGARGLPDGVGRYFSIHGARPALWSTAVNDSSNTLTLAFTLKSREAPALDKLLFAPPKIPPLSLELKK